VNEEGIQIAPYRESGVPIFAGLPATEQDAVLARLKCELEIFAEMKEENRSLRDSPRLIWRSLRKLNLTPRADIFDKICDEDVVSIYQSDQKQIFQNLKFLELVSLTLEQIYCMPWYSYSKRDSKIEAELFGIASRIFSGEIQGSLMPDTPEHEGWEIGTEGLARLSVKVKHVSPLKRDHAVAGMIVVNRCTHIGGQINGVKSK
jgi:hypothetical protein